ncbi:MAG: hypothetical protein IPJ08_13330 [Burkholderiales bacterium]|nr:hypothetical protein [Burkholderiales bacterium]
MTLQLNQWSLREICGLELPAELDAWQVAAWFARPNGWLNDARPVDQLARNLPAVLNAARADRFVAG